MKDVTIHETVFIDDPVTIGSGTRVWHFCHISKGAEIGESCVLGQNVYIANDVKIGSRVKVQNNVSIYTGCKLEDEVFLGPGCVLTNVTNPRSQVDRHSIYEKTLFKRGCTIGANATVVCGITIGRYAFIGAGCLVAKDVPDYALMVGNPARKIGWMSRHGHRLTNADENGIMICPESGFRYHIQDGSGNGKGMEVLKCLDLDEEEPLPEGMDVGKRTYDEFK